jgi:hypothetical protein
MLKTGLRVVIIVEGELREVGFYKPGAKVVKQIVNPRMRPKCTPEDT